MRALLLGLAACGRIGFHAAGGGGGDGPTGGDVAARCTTALVCDGFEQGVLDPSWMTDTFMGTVTVDAARAHRGALSVKAHTDAFTSAQTDVRATLLGHMGLPLTGTIHARIWAYFAAPNPTAPFQQILNFADDPGRGISLGARNGYVVDNDYTDGGYAQSMTTMLPVGAWTCLQLDMPTGTTGTTTISVDGTPVADIALPKTTPQPPPTHDYIGIEWVSSVASNPAVDVWIDDVLIDGAPVSCTE